ncbi:MAG: hypothetical protein M1477_00835 [Candidatus Thermoplasmatota archaeon]|nr:hypothetical protein [Candidatus Thermoplasmatota archaeon]
MNDVIEIAKRVKRQNYGIKFKCPYCGKKTTVRKILTVPGCVHFNDFDELFGTSPDSKHVDTSKVVGLVVKFTIKPNREPQVTIERSCTGVFDDDRFE